MTIVFVTQRKMMGYLLQVYKLFQQEIQDSKQDLVEEHDEYPLQLPYFAGRAMIANMKKNRLGMLKQVCSQTKLYLFSSAIFIFC